MPHDHLASQAHPCAEIAELPIAVCRLVQIHEVHVDRRPRDVTVELRVQMDERLV